jgi:sugar lactone lactonase YvrE
MRMVTTPLDTLGESPVWCARHQLLYWVDIRGPSLCRLDRAGTVTRWPMPDLIGAVMLRQGGGLIVGLRDGLYSFDPTSEELKLVFAVDESHAGNRINDSRCDRAGRIWFTTMWDFGLRQTGSLYRLDPDLSCAQVLNGFTVPNAVCFSPAGDRTYIADTPIGTIDSLATDPGTGTVSSRINLVAAGLAPGKPDGAAVDSEGFIWNARYGGAALARFAPDGRLDRIVPLPVKNPTACAFGGPDLATLFVTTARQGLDDEELAAEPMAGAVLAFEPGVRGLIEPAFRG